MLHSIFRKVKKVIHTMVILFLLLISLVCAVGVIAGVDISAWDRFLMLCLGLPCGMIAFILMDLEVNHKDKGY